MSFANAQAEIVERFSEASALLLYLKSVAPPELQPTDENTKSLKGLWLVSIYAATERSVNATTEAALAEISRHSARSVDCSPSLHSLLHYDKIRSLRDCGNRKIFDSSIPLFEASFGTTVVNVIDNPLAESLQNVDAGTMSWVLKLFGAPSMQPTASSVGRVNALRERRNAVAHGRESAAQVGERYTLQELQNIYNAADEVVSAFFLAIKEYCESKKYLREPA
jgi:hypothetical protein